MVQSYCCFNFTTDKLMMCQVHSRRLKKMSILFLLVGEVLETQVHVQNNMDLLNEHPIELAFPVISINFIVKSLLCKLRLL